MDPYCKSHEKESLFFCHKINARVPTTFCAFVCDGNWQKFYKANIEDDRLAHRKSITRADVPDWDELVTVIMPVCKEDPAHVRKTVTRLLLSARGPIEILIYLDDKEPFIAGVSPKYQIQLETKVGQRVITNMATRMARGKYLFRIDAHVAMSPGWDVRMKQSCEPKTVIVTTFDELDPETWQGVGKDLALCVLTPQFRKMFIRNWKPVKDRNIVEETMTMTGTAWMVRKKDFLEWGGHDESLSHFGGIGAEIALRAWLTGGRVLIRTDVVCYHYFKYKKSEYTSDKELLATFDKLYKQWALGEDPRITRPLEWLAAKFSHWRKSGYRTKVGRQKTKGVGDANIPA